MTGFIVLCVILLLFVLPLFLKATLSIEYNGEVVLLLRVLFFKIKLFPRKEKRRPRSMSARKAKRIKDKLAAKKAEERSKKSEKRKKKKDSESESSTKKTPAEILDIITLVIRLLKTVTAKFLKYMHLKLTRIKIKLGTGDAATTAIAYGAVTQSINLLLPILEDIKQLSLPKKSDEIDVIADFTAEESEIDLKISFSLRAWQGIYISFISLGEFIRYFFKAQQRKDNKE